MRDNIYYMIRYFFIDTLTYDYAYAAIIAMLTSF